MTLDLEPEVAQVDREKVLRALRDRIKSNNGARVTVRTDDDSAIVVAFLDDNLERANSRLESLAEDLDDAGQARILTASRQVFAWFEGVFQETAQSRFENADAHAQTHTQARADAASKAPFSPPGAANSGARGPGSLGKSRPPQTIVYADEDADFEAPAQGRGLGRRSMRIPTRK